MSTIGTETPSELDFLICEHDQRLSEAARVRAAMDLPGNSASGLSGILANLELEAARIAARIREMGGRAGGDIAAIRALDPAVEVGAVDGNYPATGTHLGSDPLHPYSDVGPDPTTAALLGDTNYMSLELAEDDHDPYLIEPWLSRTVTVLVAPPKQGKTTLAVGISIALLNGADTFLGCKVAGRTERIAWGVADAGARAELRDRFGKSELRNRIDVFDIRKVGDEFRWAMLAKHLKAQGVNLYIHDNFVTGLGSGLDSAEAKTSQYVVACLSHLVDAGIAVLVLTHPAKGIVEGLDTVSAPLGGRALAAFARSIAVIRKTGGSKLVVESNRGANLTIPLSVRFEDDVPIWERGPDEPTGEAGERPKVRKPKDAGYTDFHWKRAIDWTISESHAKSTRDLAKEVADRFPQLGSSESVRKKLPSFVRKDGRGGWERMTA